MERVGEIKISNIGRIVFSVEEWKGKYGLDIRTFIDTSNYSGPTQKGIRLHKNAVNRLIPIIGQLTDYHELREDIVIGKVAKDFDTDFVVQITNFSGSTKLDIREQVTSKKGVFYTAKGISIPIDRLDEFKELLLETAWLFENILQDH